MNIWNWHILPWPPLLKSDSNICWSMLWRSFKRAMNRRYMRVSSFIILIRRLCLFIWTNKRILKRERHCYLSFWKLRISLWKKGGLSCYRHLMLKVEHINCHRFMYFVGWLIRCWLKIIRQSLCFCVKTGKPDKSWNLCCVSIRKMLQSYSEDKFWQNAWNPSRRIQMSRSHPFSLVPQISRGREPD